MREILTKIFKIFIEILKISTEMLDILTEFFEFFTDVLVTKQRRLLSIYSINTDMFFGAFFYALLKELALFKYEFVNLQKKLITEYAML